jgi:hypothetical protein
MLIIHDNIEDYSHEEGLALEAAFNAIEETAQGGNLTLEETRVRVAYTRFKREENFKISQPTIRASTKKVKEESFDDMLLALSGETKVKAKRVSKKKEVVPTGQAAHLAKASRLFFMKQKGELLSEEDEQFLAVALAPPEVL